MPRDNVDYAVAVQFGGAALSVLGASSLPHPADLDSHFQHTPLLVKFQVA
jgi:hypothetical protein